jgi:uncharacterized protein (DUF58 family)
MRIIWERLIPSLLILAISLLAARYLGGEYYILFRAFLLLLTLDFILLIHSYRGLRYNQNFSSEHLVRGEEIHYRFYLLQSNLSTTNSMEVEFYPFHNPELKDLEKREFSLKSHEKQDFSYSIRGGTRGIYRVGISRLVMEDFMGFFQIPIPRHERTFYIYPRLFLGNGYPLKHTEGGGERVWKKGAEGEASAFSNLKEYRPGIPLRGISWKHFARYGFPVVRENESSLRPGRILMTDRRSLKGQRPQEDGVLETVLTLTKRIIDSGEGAILDGISSDGPLVINCQSAFDSLYQSTLLLSFDAPHLPYYREANEAVTLISALPGGDLLEEEFWQMRQKWQLVAVLEGMEEDRALSIRATLIKLQSKGVNIIIIDKGEDFWTAN